MSAINSSKLYPKTSRFPQNWYFFCFINLRLHFFDVSDFMTGILIANVILCLVLSRMLVYNFLGHKQPNVSRSKAPGRPLHSMMILIMTGVLWSVKWTKQYHKTSFPVSSYSVYVHLFKCKNSSWFSIFVDVIFLRVRQFLIISLIT